jgi:hypothetical protein
VFRFGVVLVGVYGGQSVHAAGFLHLSSPVSYSSAGAAYLFATCGNDSETVTVHNSSIHENEEECSHLQRLGWKVRDWPCCWLWTLAYLWRYSSSFSSPTAPVEVEVSPRGGEPWACQVGRCVEPTSCSDAAANKYSAAHPPRFEPLFSGRPTRDRIAYWLNYLLLNITSLETVTFPFITGIRSALRHYFAVSLLPHLASELKVGRVGARGD